MICPNCGKDTLEIKEVLVNRTTDPNEDDSFQDMYVCSDCQYIEEIVDEPEEEEDE